MVRFFVVGAVAAVVSGCASTSTSNGGGGGVDVSQFPDRSAVAAIAARPAPPVTARGVSLINSWTFLGPFDDAFTDTALVELTPMETTAATRFGRERFTAAGRCVARELAHVVATRGESPDARFRAHLQARCGSVATPGGLAWSTSTQIKDTADATLQASGLASALENVDGNWRGDLGVGFARVGDNAVTVVVDLPVEARLAPTSRLAQGGHVDISGVLVDGANAESIWGYVNQGETGVARCERRAGVLPRFSFSCPVADGDVVAGFELLVQRRGRLLGDGVAMGLFSTGTAPGTTWQATTWGADAAVPDDGAALADAVLQRTNGIRQGAGLTPLIDDVTQTQTTAKLAPQYFGHADDRALMDQIALGAMAGWDLKSPVRDGRFSSMHLTGSKLHELMGALLDSPSSRSTLLDAEVGPVAIGAVRHGDDSGLLLTTWVPYTAVAASEVQRTVFEALKAERRRRGHSNGLGEVGMERAVADASGRLQAGDDPSRVLSSLLRQTVDTMQRDFQGWSIITTDPDHIAWPEELLTSKMTYVAVAAGTRLKAGNPWATTAVLIVAFVEPGMVADLGTLPAR